MLGKAGENGLSEGGAADVCAIGFSVAGAAWR